MVGYQTIIKKPILSGVTPRISFRLVDEDAVGFQPDTLLMSIYDVSFTPTTSNVRTTWPPFGATPLADEIVRTDVDVLASCDSNGNVELFLESTDTEVDVPVGDLPTQAFRRIQFVWTWDSPIKTGKHEVILTIAPDRETAAA